MRKGKVAQLRSTSTELRGGLLHHFFVRLSLSFDNLQTCKPDCDVREACTRGKYVKSECVGELFMSTRSSWNPPGSKKGKKY